MVRVVVRCHLPGAKRLLRSTINSWGFLLACRIQHRQTRKAVLTIREEKSPCWKVQFMISKHACPWPARKRRKTGRLHSDKTRAGALQIQRGAPTPETPLSLQKSQFSARALRRNCAASSSGRIWCLLLPLFRGRIRRTEPTLLCDLGDEVDG